MLSLLLLLAQSVPLALPADLPDCNQELADQGIQQEMNRCAYRDYLIADAELNAQWKITSAKMKQRDADWEDYTGDTRPGWFDSLLEAQRAWLTFRDAHCRVEGYEARGGSLEPLLSSSCKAHLTRQRTVQLRELAQGPF